MTLMLRSVYPAHPHGETDREGWKASVSTSTNGWGWPRSLFSLGFGLLLLVTVTSCGENTVAPEDSSDPDGQPLAAGTFRAEVTGAMETTLQGAASFGVAADGSSFGLTLAALGPDGITIHRLQGGQPDSGEFAVEDYPTVTWSNSTDFWGTLMLVSAGALFGSESGTLTITASTANEVAGSTEFTALDDEVGRVTITATFRARR